MSHPNPMHDPENVRPEEPIYGNEDWQQAMDEEQRRYEEEFPRCLRLEREAEYRRWTEEANAWNKIWRDAWKKWSEL